MKFSEIKHKIKNLGNYKSLEEIKKAGLRIVKNTKTGDYWLIEEEFLKPVIKSLKEVPRIQVDINCLELKVVLTNKDRKNLKNTKLFDYIMWGEKVEFDKNPTCKNRKSKNREWFNLEEFSGEMLFNMSSGDRYLIPLNKKLIPIDARLYGIKLKSIFSEEEQLALVMLFNVSYLPMIYEIFGRVMTGSLPLLDLKVYELSDFVLILDLRKVKKDMIVKLKDLFQNMANREIYDIFTELGFDPNKPIREQEPKPLPDRKALDDIVFDALGLTEEERKEVYWAVAELVQNRLKKARSV
jgi:hypothetical protein